MSHRLINLAFMASVGWLVIFGVAWAVTQLIGYTGVFAWRGRAILLDTCRGEISLWTAPVVASEPLGAGEAHMDNTFYDRASAAIARDWFGAGKIPGRAGVFALGFGVVRSDELMPPIGEAVVPGRSGYGVVVPYWFLCLLSAVWPVTRSYRQHKLDVELERHLRGLCPKCGYDMRATPDRCPECGGTTDYPNYPGDGSKSATSA
jgi:hypothetical protein